MFSIFGISDFKLYNQLIKILSNVTTRGLWKLHFTELMVVRLERSTFTHFKSFH